jgi:hypothetical protein
VETRPAAGGGGNGKINVVQRLASVDKWLYYRGYRLNHAPPSAQAPGGHRCPRYADRETHGFHRAPPRRRFLPWLGRPIQSINALWLFFLSGGENDASPFYAAKIYKFATKITKLRLLPIKKPKLFPEP